MAKFSDRFLMNLKPRETPYQIRDSKGFALRVLPSGNKTFLFIYEVGGKRKQLNLGTYPYTTLEEARTAYTYAHTALARGEPLEAPLPIPAPSVITVRDLQSAYIEHIKKDKLSASWVYTKEKAMDKHLKPWHSRDITTITKTEAINLLKEVQSRGITARNPCKIFNSLFEYAVNQEMIPISPFFRITKALPNMGATNRTRVLSEPEIRHVWDAIDKGKGSDLAKRVLKLILVTGQRPGEVAGIHSREIEGEWWVIPPDRALKGKRHHRVYLTETARQLIGDAEGYIFPAHREGVSKHIVKSTVSWAVRIDKSFGLAPWTPHDLRRTTRTHMARLRVPEIHAEAVLNHAKRGMVKVYDQYEYDEEKKEALLLWEAELIRILEVR